MKKLITLAAVFALAFASFHASAITAHYRAQLQRSGCTQQTDGNGCDIHKSKAENRAAEKRLQSKHGQSLDQISSEVDTIVGMSSSEFDDYLVRNGWNHTAFGEYSKGKWKLHFKVENGKVVKSELAQ
ncbi:hypothetical protein EU642_21935 [Salmonella enterica]|nr:hypothetical protein [Salmonella enterica]EAO0118514.1 hypothetical protein [Salmonella enterica]EAO3601619.1 hypothetical protein [Salmonella enterica]EAR6391512.1 hypothetical protein [Salmonella enterica]EAV1285276.1 hypothetical protein [Salmonella enterica]